MGLTFEKVWAALMELQESQRKSQQETERLLRESREDFNRRMNESREKSEREMQALREAQQETARVARETSRSIGGLNNSFGELAEHLVAPGIEEKFNALGYHFKDIAENRKFKNEKGEVIAEIDILLENDDYSVAVEVKSKPKIADIDAFKRRLGVLRKHKDGIPDPRKIHGAIAGAIYENKVKKAVLEAGFYVVEQSGDTLKINVPEGFKPKEW
jgi:hypothetical protein